MDHYRSWSVGQSFPNIHNASSFVRRSRSFDASFSLQIDEALQGIARYRWTALRTRKVIYDHIGAGTIEQPPETTIHKNGLQ